MPLVAHSALPSFGRLADEGEEILAQQRANQQDIRELHIGLLNMMPDAALGATERQFMRLIGSSNRIAQFYFHPFSVDGIERGAEAQDYVASYYECFADIRRDGLDALIITGANISNPDFTQEPFWEPLREVVEWASEHVTTTLFACLAAHATMRMKYGIVRQRLTEKVWGVFPHRVVSRRHPLVRNINTRFDVPHSRWNEVTREQLDEAGLITLVESAEVGPHIAVSPDGFRQVFFQGHPEYDTDSLLKEYKREVLRYVRGERDDYPPLVHNYFSEPAQALLYEFKNRAMAARAHGRLQTDFPEAAVRQLLDNTWTDTAKAIFNNWLGLMYQITSSERARPFMAGVDPNDPLRGL